MLNPGNVKQITIFIGTGNCFAVIIDGKIYDMLTWDEMLGQVAATTLTGQPHYCGYTIADNVTGARWWQPAPKQLTEGSALND